MTVLSKYLPRKPQANCTVDNKVTYERWDNIAGYSTSDLTTNPRFTGNFAPDILSFEPVPGGVNIQNSTTQNFGARIRGFICPPLSAGNNYKFYLTSDNSAKVWLSTTNNPANKVLILTKEDNGDPDDAAQHNIPATATVTLNGGQKYYFEIIHKQWISSSFVKLEWEAPGLTRQIIPAANLDHFEPGPYNLPTLCGFDLKTGATYTEDIPSDIKLGEYIAIKAIASVPSPGTFSWTTINGGNDYYISAPTVGSVGTNTSTANPVFIKPGSAGSFTYRVTLTKSDGTGSCISDIKLNVTTTTCGVCDACGVNGNALAATPYPSVSIKSRADEDFFFSKPSFFN
ncbi:PA14 domain-containing protein [Emticicia sp. 17c]|uniref:PA14 domain-containing protein n=1 Tax=Emticicia sp. 17c TaxID=3127704 RepID=UPI00301DC184